MSTDEFLQPMNGTNQQLNQKNMCICGLTKIENLKIRAKQNCDTDVSSERLQQVTKGTFSKEHSGLIFRQYGRLTLLNIRFHLKYSLSSGIFFDKKDK